ncbi:hypothetical protein FRB96_002179 [Tulasnella sp. 330]|nr:hypothetical protein FRB96_002179 [Tulasnella sp. 330]
MASRKVRIEEVEDEDGDITLENLIEDAGYTMGGERSERARQENQAIIDELERKKRARSTAVPTDDNRVRARLREIGEPITLFGERAPDRRDRLKYVLSQIATARGGEQAEMESESESEDEEEEEFYTQGTNELLKARRKIAEFSLPRARHRIAQQRQQNRLPLSRTIDLRKRVFAQLKTYTNLGSQIGDSRPVSQVRFASDGRTLATGSWSGNLKIWDIPSCTLRTEFTAHRDLVGGVAWYPGADLSDQSSTLSIASGGGDHLIKLYSVNNKVPLATLKGHDARVCRINFHPSGAYLGSASFDGTWRLWDVETHAELLLQEGHSKEVYAISFQDDGALAASGGLDAIGRVWDLRSGKNAMVLDGHAQAIFAMDFSPNGYQIATGSADDTIRIWDMRAIKALHTIPAHKSNISDIRFFRRNGNTFNTAPSENEDVKMHHDADEDVKPIINPETNGTSPNGDSADVKPSIESAVTPAPRVHMEDDKYQSGLYFVSSGYDGLVKIWSADDWHLVRALSTDAGKVMSVDVSADGMFIASGSWNRSYQLFAGDNVVM